MNFANLLKLLLPIIIKILEELANRPESARALAQELKKVDVE